MLSGFHESHHKELAALDELAARTLKEYGVPYINATDVLRYIPRYVDVRTVYVLSIELL